MVQIIDINNVIVMENNWKISLVVPVYNEQEIIEETVNIYLKDLAGLFDEYELIIVDDGSTDSTGDILAKLKEFHQDKLRIITNSKNIGSGASLHRGLLSARFEFAVTNFADRPFDIRELKNIMPLFDDNIDFIVVCRHDRSANTVYRKLTSLVNYYLIRVLFAVKISDFQFVQVYRTEMLYNIKVDATGTFVPPELMLRALAAGCRMAEYKTTFYARGKGKAKCGRPRVILQTILDMFSFWFKFQFIIKNKYRTKQTLKAGV